MRLRECKLSDLHGQARSIVHIARRARRDTHFGGCLAQVYADRLSSSPIDYQAIVSAVYTGVGAEDYLGYECPECNLAHVAANDAWACCSAM